MPGDRKSDAARCPVSHPIGGGVASLFTLRHRAPGVLGNAHSQ